MTCGPEPVTFRILDRDTQWQLDLRPDLNVTLDGVIELAQLDPNAVDPAQLASVMPSPWLARGCGPCEWYVACGPTLLRYAPCFDWVVIAGDGCHIELVDAVAVAATRDHVAVLDIGRHELLVLSPGGERVIASLATAARGPIAFWAGSIVVADHDELVAYDLTTWTPRALPNAPGPFAGLVAAAGALWIAVATGGGLQLFRLDAHGQLEPAHLPDLVAAARPTGIATLAGDVVCLDIPRGGGAPRRLCIDRCGRPAEPPPPPQPPARHREGTVATAPDSPLDSGIPRCHWHRLRLDLELPERTGVTISLATADDPAAPIAEADWQHVEEPRAIRDFLVDQPPGRYLHLRLHLRGDGFATPRIRRIRIDFPRSTSAQRLPGIYREDPVAADFLDRFVATFDASLEDLDRVIERFPALVDPTATPAEALAWLGTFLDIALDPAWSEATRRAILAEAPELYRRRGTPWALARAIQLALGISPAIQELGGSIPFARVAPRGGDRGFRVGGARLFGAARARMRLGTSALGTAPLRSYGAPDRDHVAALGWRILVQVPRDPSPDALPRLRRLVDSQKPAHVVAQVRMGGALALVGVASAVGVDTRLGGLELPYLGRNTRLRRRSVLARGPARGGASMAVGTAAAVAIQTVLT